MFRSIACASLDRSSLTYIRGAGTIRAIGPKVKNKDLKVGDFVLLSINYCEECNFCKTGHPAKYVEKGTKDSIPLQV